MFASDPFNPIYGTIEFPHKKSPDVAQEPNDPGGRPRVLDDVKRRQFCALIEGGLSIREAARYVGCGERTIRREASRNPAFKESLRRSQLEAEIRPLRQMHNAMHTDWRATAWMLERAGPQRFARKDPSAIPLRQVRALLGDVRRVIRDEVDDRNQRKRIQARLRLVVDCALHRAIAPNRFGRRLRRSLLRLEQQAQSELPSEPAASSGQNVSAPDLPILANTGNVLAPTDSPHTEISRAGD